MLVVKDAPSPNFDSRRAPPDMLVLHYTGMMTAREAVARYLGQRKADGESSRGILGRARRQLATCARRLHREDLAALFNHPEAERTKRARAIAKAVELLSTLVAPEPLIGDDVAQWLPRRVAHSLHSQGIKTLAALTLRIPRRRRWWVAIPGLGAAGARHVGEGRP